MAVELGARLIEAVLKEAGDERLVVGQGDEAVADVAGSRDVVGGADAPRAAAIVGDGDNGGERDVVPLETA
ncbi:hypothetical protein D3C83_97590 [compost metagenome]